MANEKFEERHIICEVRSKSLDRAKVKGLLLELVGPARAEAGCLYYDLYQQSDVPDVFYIVDGWASDDDVATHTEQSTVTRVVERLLPLLDSSKETPHGPAQKPVRQVSRDLICDKGSAAQRGCMESSWARLSRSFS
jgi:quinol monooxygenase YgiN